MKTKTIILLFAMLFGFTSFISAKPKKEKNKETVTFTVDIDCQSCKNKIEKNIPFEKGVKAMEVDMEKNTVTVTYDTKKTNVDKLKEGFKKIGKEASVVPCCAAGHKHE